MSLSIVKKNYAETTAGDSIMSQQLELGLQINVPNTLNPSKRYKVSGSITNTGGFYKSTLSSLGQAIADGKGGSFEIIEKTLTLTVNSLYLKEALELAQLFKTGSSRGSGWSSDGSRSWGIVTLTETEV